jgi:hypothetical protein
LNTLPSPVIMTRNPSSKKLSFFFAEVASGRCSVSVVFM